MIPVVIIKDATVHERKAGDFTMRYQQGSIEIDADNKFSFQVPVPRGGEPYAAGRYTLDSRSFERGQWEKIQLTRDIVLTKLADAGKV